MLRKHQKKGAFIEKVLRLMVSKYINELQTQEQFSFALKEITGFSSSTEIGIKRELNRLSEKKEIVNLRKGFYG